MSLISRILSFAGGKRDILNQQGMPFNSPAVWQALFDGVQTDSGERITEMVAMQISTVYACVRVISESIASLPAALYQVTPTGRVAVPDHNLAWMLQSEPNPEQSAFTFWDTFAGCCALTGNAYAEIVRDAFGRPAALWPLNPRKTKPEREPNGTLVYKTYVGVNGENGPARTIQADDVFHVPLFSLDGIYGYSPVQLMRQSLGLARAAEKFGARFFGNGSRPGGILSTKGMPDKTVRAEIRDSWEQQHGGVNQGRTAVLFGDWTWQQIGLSPEESQFLATRQFQRSDICGMWRVPPQMVGDTTRLSNSNHEQQALSFVSDTLRPYLSRIEQEANRKLLRPIGSGQRIVLSFDVTERTRGDFATLLKAYAVGRQWGWYSANDVRRDLGLPLGGPELDVYLVPVNMENAERTLDTMPIADEPLPPTVNDDPDAVPAPDPESEPAPAAGDEDPSSDSASDPEGRMATAIEHATSSQNMRRISDLFLPSVVDAHRITISRPLLNDRHLAGVVDREWSGLLDELEEIACESAQASFSIDSETWRKSWRAPQVRKRCLRSIASRYQRNRRLMEDSEAELRRIFRQMLTEAYSHAGALRAAQETNA